MGQNLLLWILILCMDNLRLLGMTEVSPVISYQTPETAKPDSIGRVIPCMKHKIIDSEGRGKDINEFMFFFFNAGTLKAIKHNHSKFRL